MAVVARLVTFVELADGNASQLSFSARLDALLADGRRIELLNDRGWSQSRMYFFSEREPPRWEEPTPWNGVTREHVEETARTVVGPDSAHKDHTQAEMDEGHWSYLVAKLQGHGVEVDTSVLRTLPHEVELSDRLLARFAEPPS